MATFSIPGLSVTLACYQWGYQSGRQFGVRNEGTTDYGVLHREVTGTTQRKMAIRFAQIDAPMEQLRRLMIRAGREALPVTFTDEAGATFLVDWPEGHDFRQELENRREVELPLLEQSPGLTVPVPPSAPSVLIFDDSSFVTRYTRSGEFIARDLKGDGTSAMHSAALRPSDGRFAFLQGGIYAAGVLYCYDLDGTLAWNVTVFTRPPGFVQSGGNCLAYANGKFFVGYNHRPSGDFTGPSNPRVKAFHADTGALVGTWDIPRSGSQINGFAVSPDGNLAYWTGYGIDTVVLAFNLTSSAESTVVSDDYRDFVDVACLANGDILAESAGEGTPRQRVYRYNSSGVEQGFIQTDDNVSSICEAGDHSGFWEMGYATGGTPHVRLFNLTGAAVSEFVPTEVDGPMALVETS